MRAQTTSYLSALSGFAASLLCSGVFRAIAEYRSFVPGGEFSTATQAAVFQLFTWCGVTLLLAGAGFGLALTPVLRFRSTARFPSVLGFIGGAAVVASGWFGRIGSVGRQFQIPFPLLLASAGAVAGVFITIAAFVSSGALRTRTGAPGSGA